MFFFSDKMSAAFFSLMFATWVIQVTALDRPNVLFIIGDDLRTDLNCYFQGEDQPPQTHPKIHSPNLDKLAAHSLLFKRAYTQYSLCAPSRASFLTGRRPDSTKTYWFDFYWREKVGNFTTLPQYFKENGYLSLGYGKVFHEGPSSGNDDPPSWTEIFRGPNDYAHYRYRRNSAWQTIPQEELRQFPLPDQDVAEHTINALRRLAPAARSGKQPFFMAVGFIKPHQPFQYPEQFVKYYNISDMPLPFNKQSAIGMPRFEWTTPGVFNQFENIKKMHPNTGFNVSYPDGIIRGLRAGYYRSTSFMDSMVGKVLDELTAQGLYQNTIVSFIGDHGFHLGEQAIWRKETNFEVGVQVPMMIRVPGVTDHGPVTRELVEMVDLFPTLVDLAGLPPIPLCPDPDRHVKVCTQGISLLPLIRNPETPFKEAVFSQVKKKNIMGYTVRVDKYRYTEWVEKGPGYNHVKGRELYDYTIDKHETLNRVKLQSYSNITQHLRQILQQGWRTVAEDINVGNTKLDRRTDSFSPVGAPILYLKEQMSSSGDDLEAAVNLQPIGNNLDVTMPFMHRIKLYSSSQTICLYIIGIIVIVIFLYKMRKKYFIRSLFRLNLRK